MKWLLISLTLILADQFTVPSRETKAPYLKTVAASKDTLEFASRTPCHPILLRVNNITNPGCLRVKMLLKIIPGSQADSGSCELVVIYVGMGNTAHRSHGMWTTEKGVKSNVNAVIYRLRFDGQDKPLLLMKGDDNVLFLLDDQKNLLKGDEDFSFTFNRSSKKS